MMPVVVVAPDKFKGTLTASEAADAITRGVRRAVPGAVVRQVPVADGGEGTVDAFVTAGARRREVTVSGPLGTPVRAEIAMQDGTAIVEAAQACGLHHVRPSPATALAAHTFGVGELLDAARRAGARTIVVGLGGSASTDGGAGLAAAFGAVLHGDDGPLALGGGALRRLRALELDGVDVRWADTRVVAACDVLSPLVGRDGAAHVFAPQKGAGPAEIVQLDTGLRVWADVLRSTCGTDVTDLPGAGASGGLGAGLAALLGADLVSGAEIVLDALGIDDAITGADLVVVGEGHLDSQSLAGKAPHAVAQRATALGVPVVALAGDVSLRPGELTAAGLTAAHSMVAAAGAERSLSEPAAVLEDLAAEAVRAAAVGGAVRDAAAGP